MYGNNIKGYSIAVIDDGDSLNGFLDDVSNIFNKATDIYNQNAATLDPLRDQAVKNAVQTYMPTSTGTAQGQASTAQQGSNAGNAPKDTAPMSTGTKVALSAGGVLTIGGAIWALSSGKKKAA
jgi:hypothetical protein